MKHALEDKIQMRNLGKRRIFLLTVSTKSSLKLNKVELTTGFSILYFLAKKKVKKLTNIKFA